MPVPPAISQTRSPSHQYALIDAGSPFDAVKVSPEKQYAGDEARIAVQHRVAHGVAHQRAALSEHPIDRPNGNARRAGHVRFGTQPDALEPQQAGHVVLQAPDRVRRPHQSQYGILHELHEALGSAAARGGAGSMPPCLLQHRRHMIGHRLAVQAPRRLEYGVEFRMRGEPAGIGAQERRDQPVALLADGFRLPLQSCQRCVIQDYGLSPLGPAEPTG